jgi:hypothetical protein
MTVEDAVLLLDHHRRHSGLFTRVAPDAWAGDFVRSVSGYVRNGSALSTGQGRIALRLFYRCRAFLEAQGGSTDEILATARDPVYYREPLPSADIRREVRHLGGDLLGFRFKSNRAITLDLRHCAERAWLGRSRAWVHHRERVSVLPVTRENVSSIVDVIERHAFDLDADAAALLFSCTENGERSLNVGRQDDSLEVRPGANEFSEWFLREVLRADAVGESYVLPADARTAARLLDLGEILPIKSDFDLRALAPEPAADPARRAVQKLVANGLRGLLLADGIRRGRGVALAAARAEGAFPVIVVTRKAADWKRHLDGLTASFDPRDERAQVLFVTPDEVVAQTVLARRRGGCLIIDANDSWIDAAFLTKGPAREVPRTLMILDIGPTIRAWGGWDEDVHRAVRDSLERLFGAEEVGLLKHSAETAQTLRARGFTRVRPADLYPLFGVVSDLLGDLKPT